MKKMIDGKTLSGREKEILEWLFKGKSSEQIAGLLHISRHTVDTHRRKILKKLQAKNTIELISNYQF